MVGYPRFVRWIAAIALSVAVAACGGKPVGSKVPKAKASHMAVGAAAAAGALTLANPDLAGKKPESPKPASLKGKKTSGETVPAGVLDRSEKLPLCSELRASQAPGAAPAAAPASAGEGEAGVELIPTVKNDPPPPKCREDRPRGASPPPADPPADAGP